MRVGLMFPPAADPAGAADTARRAESQGFDFLGSGEHLFFHGPIQNAFVILAAAAAVTTRIRLLSALTIAPFYSAALLAKQAATVDRVSKGRFDLGIGIGGEHAPEFAAAGVPVSERGRRTDEILEVLRVLFRGEPVDFAGRYAEIHGLQLDPPPYQPDGPPIWIGGRKEVALRRAVRCGDVWFPYLVTPEQVGAGVRRMAELHAELAVQRPVPRTAVFGWGAVDDVSARAKDAAAQVVSQTYAQDFALLADRFLVAGSPDEVVDRIGQYADQGAEAFLFAPAATDSGTQDQMIELFAERVLPQVHGAESDQVGESR